MGTGSVKLIEAGADEQYKGFLKDCPNGQLNKEGGCRCRARRRAQLACETETE